MWCVSATGPPKVHRKREGRISTPKSTRSAIVCQFQMQSESAFHNFKWWHFARPSLESLIPFLNVSIILHREDLYILFTIFNTHAIFNSLLILGRIARGAPGKPGSVHVPYLLSLPSMTVQSIHTCQAQLHHIIPNHFLPGLPWPPS